MRGVPTPFDTRGFAGRWMSDASLAMPHSLRVSAMFQFLATEGVAKVALLDEQGRMNLSTFLCGMIKRDYRLRRE